MSTGKLWRPYSRKAAVLRWFIPNVELTLRLPQGLRLRASLRKHVMYFRRRALLREVAIASRLASYAPPDGVIYDIGANIGLYSVVFAENRTRRVISFEPSDAALRLLEQSIAINKLHNIYTQKIVLSDRVGTCRFTFDKVTTSTSHVSAPGEAGIQMACSDLDTYIVDHSLPPPDLIKMDVEGHDRAILEGMSDTLTGHRPIVFLEGGVRDENGEIGAIRILKRHRYEIWDINKQEQLPPNTGRYFFLAVPVG